MITATLPAHAGMDDAPVFRFRPMTDVEEAAFLARFIETAENVTLPDGMDPEQLTEDEMRVLLADAEPDQAQLTALFCAAFDEHLIAIDHLQIDDDPFTLEHRDQVPGGWKIALGRRVAGRALNPLAPVEEGNSFSPSSSAATAPNTEPALQAAAPSD